MKDFLYAARRKDVRQISVVKGNGVVKFKLRCSRYLYTLKLADNAKAEKLKDSFPPSASARPRWRAVGDRPLTRRRRRARCACEEQAP